VDDNSGAAATFKSYLRLLVSIDVSKPLNPGFCFTRSDGDSDWISLKYERLDIYCTNCGRIGHKQPSCLARLEARNPSRYLISLKLNVFSIMPETLQLENIKIISKHLLLHQKISSTRHVIQAHNPMQTCKNPSQVPKMPATSKLCYLVP
jgi:hypothetical protein